ncbi:MAG: DoxX family protein [Bacteroidales bacterium]|nr:DoxX family protein [Bacteroidales bacterium]
MNSFLLRIKRFCGFLFGIVFFFSGLFKLMDPVGAGLVVKEYFDFMHIGFMAPAAKFIGVTLALFETILGAALACGVWRKPAGLTALIVQSLFTVITLFLLIFNPEMDCGCFGEVLELTHLETFIKNIILLALILAYYFPHQHLGGPEKKKYVSFGIISVSCVAFMIHSLLYIPIVDFTAYESGAELLAARSDGGDEIYEAVFTYEKDGKTEEFTLDALPDSTWTFVSTDTRLKEEFEDSIIELSIFDPRTQTYADTLAAKGKVMVVSLYDTDIEEEAWDKISDIVCAAAACGIRPLILATETGTVPQALQAFAYTCDYKTLISLNRSNAGVTYFHDGTLIKKWSRRSAPDSEEVREIASGDPTETAIDYESKGSLGFQGFLLYVSAVLLLL